MALDAQYLSSVKQKIKNSAAAILALPLQLLRPHPPSPPPPPTPNEDPENGEPPSTGTGHDPLHDQQSNNNFSVKLLTLCFTAALESLLQFLQLQNKDLHFPLSFHLFSLSITCAFVTTFLEKFVVGPGTRFSSLLGKMGKGFLVAAFTLAIIIPAPMWLRMAASAIFFFALVAVFKKFWRCS